MKPLGGIAGTLIAILALTWAVQGSDFFLVQMFDRTVNRARRALSRPAPPPPPLPADTANQPSTPAATAQLDGRQQGPASPAAQPPPAVPRSLATSGGDTARSPTAASTIQPRTDGRERVITVTRRGPIVERPDRNSRALARAYEGMGLKLLEIDGEWFKVEFVERPSGTPRIGYVHVDYVRAIPRR